MFGVIVPDNVSDIGYKQGLKIGFPKFTKMAKATGYSFSGILAIDCEQNTSCKTVLIVFMASDVCDPFGLFTKHALDITDPSEVAARSLASSPDPSQINGRGLIKDQALFKLGGYNHTFVRLPRAHQGNSQDIKPKHICRL